MYTFLKTLCLSLVIVLGWCAYAQTTIKGDFVSLRANAVPSTCTLGQVMHSSSDGKIKICSSGTFVDISTPASPTFTGVVSIADGLVGTPSLAFSADLNTGLYRSATDTMNFVAGGYAGIQLTKSTGNFANAAMGGSASVSDQFPLLVERSNTSAGTHVGVSNTSTSANAYGGFRASGDNGNSIVALNAYTAASTVAAFISRGVLRSDGATNGLSLIGLGSGGTDIRLYHNGGASTDESVRFNVDKSMQIMQQIATPATPSSGIKIYGKSDGKVYKKGTDGVEAELGGASGAAGKNYIDSAVYGGTSVTGINIYADAAAASPVDGTGGTSSLSAAALNITTPLRGTSSQRFSKGAVNEQGEGWSYDFTLDRADYEGAKPVIIQYRYKTSANYASNDVRMFVYDRDGATLLSVTSLTGDGSVSASSNTTLFTGAFYPNAANNDYRLIFHVTSTNATAWDFDLVDLKVGPDQVVPGAIVTEWANYTPTGSWSTNTTYTGKWRRVGDTMEVIVSLALAGAPTNAALTVDLPSGYTIDTGKILGTPVAASHPLLGEVEFVDAGIMVYTGPVVYQSTTAVYAYAGLTSGTYANIAATSTSIPFIYAIGDSVNLKFRVPISNWLASAALSTTETMLLAARMRASGNPASAAGDAPIIFPTRDYDTTGSYSVATGLFTAPKNAYYRVHGFIISATATTSIKIFVNSAVVIFAANTDSNGEAAYTGTVYANRGDTISVRPSGTLDVDNLSTIQIEEIPDFSIFSVYNTVDRQYDLTLSGPAGWSTTRAVGIPYMTADGAWRLKFNFDGNLTAATSIIITVTGVTFKGGGVYQAIAGWSISSAQAINYARVDDGTSTIVLNFPANTTRVMGSGDVELASKPTFVP